MYDKCQGKPFITSFMCGLFPKIVNVHEAGTLSELILCQQLYSNIGDCQSNMLFEWKKSDLYIIFLSMAKHKYISLHLILNERDLYL